MIPSPRDWAQFTLLTESLVVTTQPPASSYFSWLVVRLSIINLIPFSGTIALQGLH